MHQRAPARLIAVLMATILTAGCASGPAGTPSGASGASPRSTAGLAVPDRAAPVSATAAASEDLFVVEVVGSGPDMILIPGMASSGDVWDGLVERYRDRYTLHVLTLAGFAGVPAAGTESFLPRQRDAILGYIAERGLDRPALVGHSLGGFLAFWVASEKPSVAGPLIAVDGVPFLLALNDTSMTETSMAAQADQAAAFYATMSPEQMAAQTRMAAQAMVTGSEHVETITQWGAASDPATAGRAYAEMMTTDLRDDVARIESPVLLIAAGGGQPEAARERLRNAYAHQLRALPGARVEVAPYARHFIMLDDPEYLFRTMDAFLAAAGAGVAVK